MTKVMPTDVLQPHQLELHGLAQLGVERRQRLVQQQHPRPLDQGAGQSHALALAAGQLVRHAVGEPLHLDQRQGFRGALAAFHRPARR